MHDVCIVGGSHYFAIGSKQALLIMFNNVHFTHTHQYPNIFSYLIL